ncbi:MAG: type II toxin-antitoxin system RelE/ParE family toxin [Proteobacteria bacterium]|nr:type II toxin-antitoxin system RelE/ParE family toxin [Pseudomonadota bacterium]
MSTPVVRTEGFDRDLSEAYAYLASRSTSAGERFLDAVDAVAMLLAEYPEIGRVRFDIDSVVRSFRVRGFRHTVFYDYADETVVLVRLLHGRQDPSSQSFDR